MNLRKLKNQAGFTLVELIVVIAIMAILAGVAVPVYSGYIEKAEKAGDLQLLGAVNSAFGAACVENNVAPTDLADGSVTFDTANMVPSKYADEFEVYFDGNSGPFKVIQVLKFQGGVFVDVELSDAYKTAYNNIVNTMGTQIGVVQGSGFATIGGGPLLEQIDGISGMVTESLSNPDSTMSGIIFDEEGKYMGNLASMLGLSVEELDAKLTNMSEEDAAKFLANSTVLSVAQTANDPTKMNKESMITLLQSGNYGQIATAINTGDAETGLAQAALLYGMYTAYNPNGAANLNSTAGLTALAGDNGFKEYLSELGTDGSQAQKDMDGYLAALEIVNNAVKDSPETANQVLSNGYEDPELVAIIQQVLGSKVS